MNKTFFILFLCGILAGCAGLSPAGEKSGDLTGGSGSGNGDRGIAKVNGVEISSGALSKTEDLIRAQNLEAGRNSKDDEVRSEAIDRLILQELIYQRAVQLGMKAAEKDIDLYIQKIRESAGSEEAYQEFLLREKLSEKDLRTEAERSILIRDLYAEEVTSRVVVPEQEMRAEYEKEKDKFTIPEKIVLTDVIFLLDPKDSSSIKKANDVLDILRDGKKDPAQLESDGSFVVRELTNPGGTDLPLREEAAKLKEGELSGVIITGGNIHIIKLRTYSRKKLFEFDAVKRMIENNLRAEATKIRLQEWKTKLKSSADIEIFGSKK
jgi:foldase protein PrsA